MRKSEPTPGMVSTSFLLFVTHVREVSSSMMVFTYGTETMSIALIGIVA
jgi:ABC-type Fe3+ transport system permease subunit